ncbi:unnamed protein product [Auanema sp. JU1783]|nr:unnamed protein product [Auanema sp. JU1783]
MFCGRLCHAGMLIETSCYRFNLLYIRPSCWLRERLEKMHRRKEDHQNAATQKEVFNPDIIVVTLVEPHSRKSRSGALCAV